MKIFIIGGGGYIGSVLTEYFLSKNHEVLVLDILRNGSDGVMPFTKTPLYTFINSDFNTDLLPIVFKTYQPEIVIHLAAIVGDPNCAKEPELARKTNVEGVRWVTECCNNQESIEKLFFASTCSVYGRNDKTCIETTETNPLSLYAETKLEAEEIIRKNSRNGFSFRLGTMYGWSPNMRFNLVVNLLTRMAAQDSEFSIFDGTQLRPFLHPHDLALFFESLFERDLSNFTGEIFNLVSENLSMLELGELIERTLPYAIMNLDKEKEDNRSYICRCFKAHSLLGFSPKIRVREGIQEIESHLIHKKQKIDLSHLSLSY